MMKRLSLFLTAAALCSPLAPAQEPAAPAPAPTPAAKVASVRLLESETLPIGQYQPLAAPAPVVALLKSLDVSKLPIVPDEKSEVTFHGVLADFALRRGGQSYILTMYRTPEWFKLCRATEGTDGYILGEEEGEQDGDFRDAKLYAALMDALHAADDAGDTNAQLLLARHYMSTRLDENHEAGQESLQHRALALFERAAKGGNAAAQYDLGNFYAQGMVVTQDNATALEWFHAAARQQHPGALYMLGSMHEKGLGVAASLPEAIQFYTQAAYLGNTEAMVRLGQIYYNGEGVKQDRVEGIMWHCRACELGDMKAQIFLEEVVEILDEYHALRHPADGEERE